MTQIARCHSKFSFLFSSWSRQRQHDAGFSSWSQPLPVKSSVLYVQSNRIIAAKQIYTSAYEDKQNYSMLLCFCLENYRVFAWYHLEKMYRGFRILNHRYTVEYIVLGQKKSKKQEFQWRYMHCSTYTGNIAFPSHNRRAK